MGDLIILDKYILERCPFYIRLLKNSKIIILKTTLDKVIHDGYNYINVLIDRPNIFIEESYTDILKYTSDKKSEGYNIKILSGDILLKVNAILEGIDCIDLNELKEEFYVRN